MARKRRMFDIEIPGGEPEAEPDASETFPVGKTGSKRTPADGPEQRIGRRGPMAAAISETADSARARGEVEARIRAENDALAHEHVRLKRLGLIVDLIPLDRIEMHKLVRDRQKGMDHELDELKGSIAQVGLSNPIRVEARGDGRFELIQGFRRLSAYRELWEETRDDQYAAIPAAISQPGDSLDDLYRRMVDENLVRKDISFAEMARLAIDFASDPTTGADDPEKAVASLFRTASYSKRSYIRNFIRLVDTFEKDLHFMAEIPRALGLKISQRLEEDKYFAGRVRGALEGMDNRSAAEEISALKRLIGEDWGGEVEPSPLRETPLRRTMLRTGKAKTSFQVRRREGQAKCTAASGRIEVRLDRDFSVIDRRRLEAAVQAMLDRLD